VYHNAAVCSTAPVSDLRQRVDSAALRYTIAPLASHKRLLARFVLTSAARTLCVMATVLLMQQFLVAVLDKRQGFAGAVASRLGDAGALWLVGGLLVVAYVGASVLYYDHQLARQRMVKVVELGLMERLVRHLLGLSVRFFDRSSHGDLVHAIRQDVANLRIVLMAGATIVMEGAVALGLLGAAVWISPRLAFWALLVLPAAVLPVVVIARRTRARSFAERQTGYVVFDMILQLLRGIRIIKVFQGEDRQAATTIEHARRYFDEQIRLVQIRELSNVLLESLAGLSVAAVVIVGGLQVMQGVLQWPQLLAFLIAVRSLHGPLDHINFNIMEVQRHGAAAARIDTLLAERSDVPEAETSLPLRLPPRRITFEQVTFSYGNGPVLQDVCFEVLAGEAIGIVGPSGSGKTTLLSLIARFFDPTSGAVRFDGADLRALRLQDVCRQVAIVTQEPFLFATSVRDNIRCGRPDASDAEVEAAARAADIHDEILGLSQGYDTPLGAEGRLLSGGQSQRVNVARAILKNPPVLLLDEATSSLDSLAEARVQGALDRLMAGRTSFVVAHRLSTVRHADRILVLDRGAVVGLDNHEGLLRACPLYRLMWETQLLGDAEAPLRTDPSHGSAHSLDRLVPLVYDARRIPRDEIE